MLNVVATALILLAQASSPQAPAAAPSTTVEEVVVTARRQEAVRAFVDAVSAPTSQGQLGRWDRRICPGVYGMTTDYARLLADRVAMAAYRVGLDVGEPGCSPNVLILVTPDSDTLAREMVQQHPRLFSRSEQHGNTRGRTALDDFVRTPRPVRWWHVSQTTTDDGTRVNRGESVTVRSAGRVRRRTREDFDRVVIILDANRSAGRRFGAVADYVAMVALAQLDPGADVRGRSTILNLFEDRALAAITADDVAYLQGLYSASREANSATVQQREIAGAMRSAPADQSSRRP